jgi:hypothetical protein
MVVKAAVLDDLVAKMPSSYAAMPQFEFFAELYSLYYDKDDPQRKVIPADVAKWLDENIGTRDPNSPRRPAARGLRISPATPNTGVKERQRSSRAKNRKA